MDEKRARAVVGFALRREQQHRRLMSLAFDKQRTLLRDPSRLKSVLCSRRAGKSYGIGLGLYEAALEKPYVNCLYIGLVRQTAKDIMWGPILKRLARDLELDLRRHDFNETSLTVTLKNHSTIRLVGMDKDQDQMDKVLGPGYRRIAIDEAASFRIDLKRFVYSHLKPATADHLGDIWLAGTPGPVRAFYYRVTKGLEPGWAQHTWNTLDNPHMHAQWKQELAEILRDRPSYMETPEFRMMYHAEWFTDEENLCYHYDDEKNACSDADLPSFDDGVIACDLGYNDDTAFTVNGWNPYDPTLYFLLAEKKTKMLITDVANRFGELRAAYPFVTRLVVDGANKQAVEEMRHRHDLPLIATEKKGKTDYIFQMDTDLRTSKVKLLADKCLPLITEWSGLVWDKKAEERNRRKVEHPSCPNHCSDSALYGWRYARNFFASAIAERRPEAFDPRWGDDYWRRKQAQMARDEREMLDDGLTLRGD